MPYLIIYKNIKRRYSEFEQGRVCKENYTATDGLAAILAGLLPNVVAGLRVRRSSLRSSLVLYGKFVRDESRSYSPQCSKLKYTHFVEC